MPFSQLRFLVAEDHEFQRSMLERLLRSLGARAVHSAEDGRAALQVLNDPDRPVDLVITDLSMPGMDGMELVRHISESGSKVSLILTSSLDAALLASVANMALAYKVQLLGVLGKPPSAAKLLPLIELHRARASGRVDTQESFTLEEIATSWANNDFEPWFEPQVDLATRKVCGIRATPRWRHPERGLLEQDEFLPSIKARGLLEDYAWLMLQKSAAHCRVWREGGLDLFVWVPMLFDSWGDITLASRVSHLVNKEQVSPRNLVLGLAEPALNTDAPRALENLARLRMDGFGLALDDFGSGTLALDRMALVAFSHLRIGPAFVRNSDFDESAKAGLAVALDLAAQLRLQVIADGIAREEEWRLLQDWGCHYVQGPGISPALQADELFEWTRKWNSTGTISQPTKRPLRRG
jgi:EAL domain-containing protein (putative c-di-GMP-specific phosphodiesterase class I)/FixJ family two-component response regulator